MAEFNIDDVLSEFGTKPKTAKKSSFDIDSILSEFGGKPETVSETKKPTVNSEPRPPISGLSKESSDEYNRTTEEKRGGENPRRKLPTTSIQESMAEHGIAAKELLGQAVTDFETGHPYKAIGKGALGIVSGALSPITGAVEGAVGTPITDITGNKDIGDRAAFVAGSAIPIGPTGSAVSKAIPKNKALSTLVENIGQDNLPAVVSAMKANPRLAPADLSPRVLQDTQHLFTSDGPQIDYLKNASDTRMATRRGTIESAYDASAGVPVELAQKISDLSAASKKVGNDLINPALAKAKPVDVSSTVEAIDNILKPGVNSVITGESSLPLTAVKKELVQIKSMLANDKEMRTGAADLHKFQSGLRKTAEGLLKSSSGADREMGHALMNVRNNLVSDIDKSAPGYKDALSKYRDEMHIADAFKEGHDKIFTSSKKIENDPSFVKKWYEGLSEHEQQAVKEGARTAIYTEMGVAKNPALAGESIARSDFNKAKMEIIFGKEETGKLLKALEDERAIANTHNKIVEGSQTAMRSASKDQFALPSPTEIGQGMVVGAGLETANILAHGTPGVGTALLVGAKASNALKDSIKLKLAKEHNAQYAKYALPTEGPSRDELIRQLEARIPGPKPSMLARTSSLASKVIP